MVLASSDFEAKFSSSIQEVVAFKPSLGSKEVYAGYYTYGN